MKRDRLVGAFHLMDVILRSWKVPINCGNYCCCDITVILVNNIFPTRWKTKICTRKNAMVLYIVCSGQMRMVKLNELGSKWFIENKRQTPSPFHTTQNKIFHATFLFTLCSSPSQHSNYEEFDLLTKFESSNFWCLFVGWLQTIDDFIKMDLTDSKNTFIKSMKILKKYGKISK